MDLFTLYPGTATAWTADYPILRTAKEGYITALLVPLTSSFLLKIEQ